MDLREAKIVNIATWLIINQPKFLEEGVREKVTRKLTVMDNEIFDMRTHHFISPSQGEFFLIRKLLFQLQSIFEVIVDSIDGNDWAHLKDIIDHCLEDYQY